MRLKYIDHSRKKSIDTFLKEWENSEETITVNTSGSTGKPKLIISNKGGKVLLEFRVKQENKPNGEIYFRNYIEKGPLLGDLIASMA